MITYQGVTAFTLQSEEPAAEHYGLPTVTQTYKGAAYLFDAFWASVATGTPRSGGYITNRSGANKGIYPEISITIALPPNFNDYKLSRSRMQQTASKGATITNSSIIPDETEIECNRTVSFISPQAVYSYYASSRPDGPRFTSPLESQAPLMLRSIITATAGGKSRTYYGNAPSALVSALAMPQVGIITGHTSDPIPGTPWYQCQDVISYVYRGDDT